jgi:hypothetical protein
VCHYINGDWRHMENAELSQQHDTQWAVAYAQHRDETGEVGKLPEYETPGMR